jgi:hypothetical protein
LYRVLQRQRRAGPVGGRGGGRPDTIHRARARAADAGGGVGASAGRRGAGALIVGEAGIGKSRLVQEFKEALAETPHTWIERGGAAYYDTTPFHVVVDLLRQGFGWAADLPTEPRLDALDQSLAVVGLKPAEGAPVIAPPPTWRASSPVTAVRTKHAPDSLRSAPHSPRASTPPTSKPPRRCWRNRLLDSPRTSVRPAAPESRTPARLPRREQISGRSIGAEELR